ncbi:TIGR03067 domain-containing protein [Aporhodopirellula aestuarii]|uniref:TIGR03067 domain-containing protein n=1 Tax=Aporhodopirellula aestuarii TaxID=2950107 RepID=A0ABT0U6F0_9BACT|nr:TIGR03067 domain-containing protein [Aporhodopirellula aestuarii]MCM2372500.1 TIGR03067 domain-containing protein [Aporhodopirellula aestuarii]
MHFLVLIVVLCFVSGAIAEDDASESTQRDQSSQVAEDFSHDGVWKPKGAILGGVFLPPPALKGITLTIDHDQYEVTVDGEEHSDKGTFTLDETTTPKRMTIKSNSGPNKGKTILAIYEVKNADAMRVCYDLSGKAFPKEFKAPKGSELYLVGYRRQAPDAKDSKPSTTFVPVE